MTYDRNVWAQEPKNCKQCGKIFTSNYPHKVFCSAICYKKFYKIEPKVKPCLVCNKLFIGFNNSKVCKNCLPIYKKEYMKNYCRENKRKLQIQHKIWYLRNVEHQKQNVRDWRLKQKVKDDAEKAGVTHSPAIQIGVYA